MDVFKTLLIDSPTVLASDGTGLLQASNNLSDVDDVSTARDNLEVLSEAETLELLAPRLPAAGLQFTGVAGAQAVAASVDTNGSSTFFRFTGFLRSGGSSAMISLSGLADNATNIETGDYQGIGWVPSVRSLRLAIYDGGIDNRRRAEVTLSEDQISDCVDIIGVIDRAAGTAALYLNGAPLTTSETSAGSAPAWTTTLTGGYQQVGYRGTLTTLSATVLSAEYGNVAITAAEVARITRYGSADLPSYKHAAGAGISQTSGTLVVGKRYRITTFVAGDSFTNVGAGSNATGVEFTATGTTPTTYSNGSTLTTIGLCGRWVFDRNTGLTVPDLSGATNPLLLSTSGVSWLTDDTGTITIDNITVAHGGAGNLQFGGQSLIDTDKGWAIESLIVVSDAAVTWSFGSASGGAQYVSSYSLASGVNYIADADLVTRIIGTANLWSGSSGAANITLQLKLRRTS